MIGSGGYGEIYYAIDLKTSDSVAVKVEPIKRRGKTARRMILEQKVPSKSLHVILSTIDQINWLELIIYKTENLFQIALFCFFMVVAFYTATMIFTTQFA